MINNNVFYRPYLNIVFESFFLTNICMSNLVNIHNIPFQSLVATRGIRLYKAMRLYKQMCSLLGFEIERIMDMTQARINSTRQSQRRYMSEANNIMHHQRATECLMNPNGQVMMEYTYTAVPLIFRAQTDSFCLFVLFSSLLWSVRAFFF